MLLNCRRGWPILLAICASCGSGSKTIDAPSRDGLSSDGATGDGAIVDASTVDAPVNACTPVSGTTLRVRAVTTITDTPLLVTSPPGDVRLFVVGRNGGIEIIEDGTLLPTKFLDISDNVGGPVLGGGERGLLGLAFHPQYGSNGRFFVYYTTATANVVAEYAVTADRNVADPGSGRILLSIPDSRSNHNGGMIEFGSDGYLYIGTGDGGGGGDPDGNGQDLSALLAKILRIDVNSTTGSLPYGIPSGNPYAGGGGAPEVFIYGLRNPWRWSFDAANGDLYIGDVGQDAYEEVSVVPANGGGTNLGWSYCEGNHDYGGNSCSSISSTLPIIEHPHTIAVHSVIGGQVYRGSCYPDLQGTYIYADYGFAGRLYTLVYTGGIATNPSQINGVYSGNVTSIHAAAFGEIYLTTEGGAILHLEAAP
jgi:glucose/arabinose dehydrogenase